MENCIALDLRAIIRDSFEFGVVVNSKKYCADYIYMVYIIYYM